MPPPPGPGAAPFPPPAATDAAGEDGGTGGANSKRTIAIVGVVVVALIAGYFLFVAGGDDGPSGYEVVGSDELLTKDNAEAILAAAEADMRSIAGGDQNAIADDAACFLSYADGTSGPIDRLFYCGPALLASAPTEADQWLTGGLQFGSVEDEEPWRGQLSGQPAQPHSLESLFRPDGAAVPEPTLTFPPPPPVEENFVRSFQDLPDVELEPHDTVLRGAAYELSLEGSTLAEQVAFGRERFLAADGQTFLVVRTENERLDGAGFGSRAEHVLVVDGVKRTITLLAGLQTTLIGVPADTEEAILEIVEGDVTQSMSLITGELGDDVVAVLQRSERSLPVNETVALDWVHTTENTCAGSGEMRLSIDTAELGWGSSTMQRSRYGVEFDPPDDLDQADLVLNLSEVDVSGGEPGCSYRPVFTTESVTATVDGEAVPMAEAGTPAAAGIRFVVPADATDVTITFAPGSGILDESTRSQAANGRYDFGDQSVEVDLKFAP